MSARNGIFVAIMLVALVLLLAATGLLPALWQGLVNTVDSTALFIWSLLKR